MNTLNRIWLTERIEQTVKLIRSRGVGVFFVTQSPSDIPNAVLAQRELAEKYPNARLEVVNSRNVSMGEAYLAMEAAKQRVEGKTVYVEVGRQLGIIVEDEYGFMFFTERNELLGGLPDSFDRSTFHTELYPFATSVQGGDCSLYDSESGCLVGNEL